MHSAMASSLVTNVQSHKSQHALQPVAVAMALFYRRSKVIMELASWHLVTYVTELLLFQSK
jgi:hypothetical protein